MRTHQPRPGTDRFAFHAARKRGGRGSSLVEATLIAPWFLFLIVGVVDMGFYSYDMIAVENAARVAAEYTSQSSTVQADQAGACGLVLAEMSAVPNHGVSPCTALPLIVTATAVNGPDLNPATRVSVRYRSSSLIPIPGLLEGRLDITRTAEMRVKP